MANVNEQNLNDEGHENDHENTDEYRVFSNPVILNRIAKYFTSIEDIKSFRLVSSTCKRVSSLIWRGRACVHLYVDEDNDAIDKYLERMDEHDRLSNYKLEKWYFPPHHFCNSRVEDSVNRFWWKCGPRIKHLTLKRCSFDQIRLVTLICNFLPNLESLKIQDFVDTEGLKDLSQSKQLQPHKNLKIFYAFVYLTFSDWRFLQYFPNLEEIKLLASEDKNLIPTLSELRSKSEGLILNLKVLEVADNDQSLDGFTEAKFPLTRMSLYLGEYVDKEMLRNVMSSVCGTLKVLKLSRYPFPDCPQLSLSKVDWISLEELYLNGNVASNFNFLMWMPSLRYFNLDLTLEGKIPHRCGCAALTSGQSPDLFFPDLATAKKLFRRTLMLVGRLSLKQIKFKLACCTNCPLLNATDINSKHPIGFLQLFQPMANNPTQPT